MIRYLLELTGWDDWKHIKESFAWAFIPIWAILKHLRDSK